MQYNIKEKQCPKCGDVFITPSNKLMPNHAQIKCDIGNNKMLHIALCDVCARGTNVDELQAILEVIKSYWTAHLEKTVKDEKMRERMLAERGKYEIKNIVSIRFTGQERLRK